MRKEIASLACALLLSTAYADDAGTESLGCAISNCTIDLNFVTHTFYGCDSASSCVDVKRDTIKWAKWKDGHYSQFDINTAAITDRGLLVEQSGRNFALYARDCTKSEWKKTNALCSLTATGIDGSANSASTASATGPDGTVCQSVSISVLEQTFSVFMRRRAGNGEIDLSIDNGTEWVPVDLSSDFQRFAVSANHHNATSNPTICVRIVTSGDAVDVDFNQFEGQLFSTSPILTTAEPATRMEDRVNITGSAAACLTGSAVTLLFYGSGYPPNEFRTLGQSRLFTAGSMTLYVDQFDAKNVHASMGNIKNVNSATLGPGYVIRQGSMARLFAIGAAWDSSGNSLVADGGEVTRSEHTFDPGNSPTIASSYNGYVNQIVCFNSRLIDTALVSLTDAHLPETELTDSKITWSNRAAGGVVMVGGLAFSAQNGSDTRSIQVGPHGNLVRFNLLPNNPWLRDAYPNAERSELAGYRRFYDGDTVWVSYSFYLEPGDPMTTNWNALGQWYPGAGTVPFAHVFFHPGGILSWFVSTDGKTAKAVHAQTIRRGIWYHIVENIKFDPKGGAGFARSWLNGAQVVDVAGNVGSIANRGYYWKFGSYRGPAAPEYFGVRYANMTVGTADLSSKVTNPDPIPDGYCYCLQ